METAKCANCGEDTGKAASENWTLYCGKETCRQAFMDSVIADTMNPKGKRKKTEGITR